MTAHEAKEYRTLRDRYDAAEDDDLSSVELARFLELDGMAIDELDARVAACPLIRHDHAMTIGNGAWSCACGAGESGLGREAYMGAHRHDREIRATELSHDGPPRE